MLVRMTVMRRELLKVQYLEAMRAMRAMMRKLCWQTERRWDHDTLMLIRPKFVCELSGRLNVCMCYAQRALSFTLLAVDRSCSWS